jgi:hypothetical protein
MHATGETGALVTSYKGGFACWYVSVPGHCGRESD